MKYSFPCKLLNINYISIINMYERKTLLYEIYCCKMNMWIKYSPIHMNNSWIKLTFFFL